MLSKQIETLARFIPVQAAEHVADLISQKNIQLKISRGRQGKLGDFRPAATGSLQRISVNATLNIYAFLLVFLHELAHLLVWEKYQKNARPHGREWKQQFGQLIREYVGKGFFHPSLEEPLLDFSGNVRATGLGSPQLVRALRIFDKDGSGPALVFLEELPGQSLFVATNGKRFLKEDRIRTRYRCLCLENKRHYLFHPLARVRMIETIT